MIRRVANCCRSPRVSQIFERDLREKSKSDLLLQLDSEKRRKVLQIYKTLQAAGHECYLVGGVIRDLLLGRAIGDIDFATSAKPEQVEKLFRRTIPTGIKHGTVTVMFDKSAYEITTYRSEAGYSDARHPDRVAFSNSLSEDLKRRDFTVNALAYEPGKKLLVDQHGGLNDLERGSLRAIGTAEERFCEDGLRPVRACRLSATLEFDIESRTKAALKQAKVQKRSAMIAIERFTEELWKGFNSQRVSRMIASLEESGLLYLFMREAPREGTAQERTSEQCLQELERLFPANRCLRLAYWWQQRGIVSEQQAQKQGRALRFSTKEIRLIRQFLRHFHFQEEMNRQQASSLYRQKSQMEYLYQIRCYLSALKNLFRSETESFIKDTAPYFHNSVTVEEMLAIYRNDPLIVNDLDINGRALIELGLKGPQIGSMLTKLLDAVLRDPAFNRYEELLKRARSG